MCAWACLKEQEKEGADASVLAAEAMARSEVREGRGRDPSINQQTIEKKQRGGEHEERETDREMWGKGIGGVFISEISGCIGCFARIEN